MSGHMLIKILSQFSLILLTCSYLTYFFVPFFLLFLICFTIVFFLFFLELAICMIQSYIFMILQIIYLQEIIE